MAQPQPPALAMLRRGLWAALHGALVLATLRLLSGMRKQGQDLYFLYYQVLHCTFYLGTLISRSTPSHPHLAQPAAARIVFCPLWHAQPPVPCLDWRDILGGIAVSPPFSSSQPFLPMLAMLWFWAAAVRVFERRRIRYDVCFPSEEQRYLLRSSQLFQASSVIAPAPPAPEAFSRVLAWCCICSGGRGLLPAAPLFSQSELCRA